MRVLAISSAAHPCALAMVQDGRRLAGARLQRETGLPEALSLALRDLLAEAGLPDLIAANVGPGSFTGLRAGLALAAGLALGASVPLVGVIAAEAFAEALPALGGRALWAASVARRGHVFIARGGMVETFAEDAIPDTRLPIAVAGNAANFVAAALAARGRDVMLTDARVAQPEHIAAVGLRRHAGLLPPCDAVPLYVEPALARLPRGGLRPEPAA